MPRRRAQGSGSVFYDRGARSWVALVSLGSRNGRRVRRKVRAHTEAAARAELDRLLRAYRAGSSPASTTVDDYLHGWLEGHRHTIRASTAESYKGHVERHISPLLGGILVARLQAADVRRLISDRLSAGLSPATVGRIVTTLRIALNEAVHDQAIPYNAAAGVKLPRVVREPVRAATADDYARIREAVRGDELEALYVLLMGTGMRAGEACALDWRDLDLDAGTVFIRQGKTPRAIRTVNLSGSVIMALRAHRAKAKRVGPMEPVFVGPRTGERLRTWTVSHAFPLLLKRAGLRRMRVHDLRHGFATRAITKGASLRTVADILGHSRPSITTDVYAHVVPEDQRKAVDVVGAELA